MSVHHPGRHGCITHKHSGLPQLIPVALLALAGCATFKEMPLSELDTGSLRYRSASPPSFVPAPEAPAGDTRAKATVAQVMKDQKARTDAFDELLLRAGLESTPSTLQANTPLSSEDTELPPRAELTSAASHLRADASLAPEGVKPKTRAGLASAHRANESITPENAAALFDALLEQPVTVASFGPRLVASRLLREVVEGNVELPRAKLLERLKRFDPLSVTRPDGYLARALTGETRQRAGEVQWREGAFHAGPFEVGAFYAEAKDGWKAVDATLQAHEGSPVLAEAQARASIPVPAKDGKEDATSIELVLALGQLLTKPGANHLALSQLPEGLVTLITASPPEYQERFRKMTRGEQVQALSRLATVLLSTWGTTTGATRTLAAMGLGWETHEVTALSLTAEGSLALERVDIPVWKNVTVLGAGPGAAVILHVAASPPSGSEEPPTSDALPISAVPPRP
ncbi:hypothetical protein ACLESO_08185 [Pyxidicoccus sp. 3LG]